MIGAGGGIGRAVAASFAVAGWAVTVADIDADLAREVAAETGADAAAVDVTDRSSVDRLLRSRPEAPEVVVNCAGAIHVAQLLEHRIDEWRRIFAVNVEGAVNVVQSAAEGMAGRAADEEGCRGRIVLLGSPAAAAARPLLSAYGASKAAMDHFARSAAATLGPLGVWVVVVYPTNVEEGMWSRLPDDLSAATGATADEERRRRLATVPSGRFQKAGEVAAAVQFAATGAGLNGRLIWSEAHVTDL